MFITENRKEWERKRRAEWVLSPVSTMMIP